MQEVKVNDHSGPFMSHTSLNTQYAQNIKIVFDYQPCIWSQVQFQDYFKVTEQLFICIKTL